MRRTLLPRLQASAQLEYRGKHLVTGMSQLLMYSVIAISDTYNNTIPHSNLQSHNTAHYKIYRCTIGAVHCSHGSSIHMPTMQQPSHQESILHGAHGLCGHEASALVNLQHERALRPCSGGPSLVHARQVGLVGRHVSVHEVCYLHSQPENLVSPRLPFQCFSQVTSTSPPTEHHHHYTLCTLTACKQASHYLVSK